MRYTVPTLSPAEQAEKDWDLEKKLRGSDPRHLLEDWRWSDAAVIKRQHPHKRVVAIGFINKSIPKDSRHHRFLAYEATLTHDPEMASEHANQQQLLDRSGQAGVEPE
jgi:hypothetical protein